MRDLGSGQVTAGEWLPPVLLLLHMVVGFIAAVAVSTDRRPSSAIAWILLIVFVPLVGLIVFFLVGFGRLPLRRRARQKEVCDWMRARPEMTDRSVLPTSPVWAAGAVTLNSQLGSLPMVSGNSARLIAGYTESFDAMIADIDAATDYVHVEFYILVLDGATKPFFDALARACARGVTVRVLSDHVSGFLAPHRKETQQALARMGAQWHAMLPLRPWRGQWQRPDMRNHRKLVVVDGQVAHTGSQNLIDASYHKPRNVKRGLRWKELMVRLTGPIVAEIDAIFVTDWYSETDEVLPLDALARTADDSRFRAPPTAVETRVDAQAVPSGPSFENDNNLKLFALMIQNARRRISVTSPYFVPEEATLLALVTAASRGVQVELFVSAIGDQVMVYHAQRSYYEALLRAGVKIYLYRAPVVLHAKHFSIDDDMAVIGTSNMDIRSFSLNMEVSLLVSGRDFVDEMRKVEDDYRRNSDQLSLQQWSSRSTWEKTLDSLARLASSLQ
jgi:cardiolipin synthase